MNYLWIDMEMSGLDVSKCRILEVAAIVTDGNFVPLETYQAVVHQAPEVLAAMDEWCTQHHGQSGLTAAVAKGLPEGQVEQQLLALVGRHWAAGERPVLAGNSIGQDRKFIDAYMPALSARLHYRLLDVSSFKIVFNERYGIRYEKQGTHRALDDIRESISELSCYLRYVKPGGALTRWLKRFGPGVGLALLVSLGALELGLRALPPPAMASNWLYDPVLGHRGPLAQDVKLISLPEKTHYNSFGFRGAEPDNTGKRFTVFVLGDSITEGVQVPWAETYSQRLASGLRSPPGRAAPPQVVAWSSSDYGTADELVVYSRLAKALPQDVVALQFLGLNDYVNNTYAFADQNQSLSDYTRPYLVPDSELGAVKEFDPLGNGTKFTYLYPFWKTLREKSRLFSYVDFFWYQSLWNWRRKHPTGVPPNPCSFETQVFLDEGGPDWAQANAVTLRLAQELKAQVASHQPSPRLLAFYVPSLFEVSEADWKAGLAPNLAQCKRGDFHRENPERRFLEIFREAGIEAVSLRDAILKSGIPPRELYFPDGHFSRKGHQVVADALRVWIEARP